MASPPTTDALGLLSAALSARNPRDQDTHLSDLYALLRSQPGNIPILLPSLIQLLPKAGPSLKRWIADVMDLAFCRLTLSSDTKQTLAVHTPDAILLLLREGDPKLAKIAEQCFASVYPLLFRIVCNDQSKQPLWRSIEAVKAQIYTTFDTGARGPKIGAIKCFQRIIQAQSRAPLDPRTQTKADISLSTLPANHRFLQAQPLEEEANRLLTRIITLIFTSSEVDLVMATMNVLATLAKARQQLANVVLEALASWTPAALAALAHTQIRNVEKTVRTLYFHFLRNSLAGAHAPALQKAAETQKRRMEEAARVYQQHREAQAQRKHQRQDVASAVQSPKRIKTEAAVSTPPPPAHQPQGDGQAFRDASLRDTGANALASFDVKTLPINLVVELIVANLEALSDADLQSAISRMRTNLGPDAAQPSGSHGSPQPQPQPQPPALAAPGIPPTWMAPAPAPIPGLKAEDGGEGQDDQDEVMGHAEEVQDPLKMDVGEDEELEAMRLDAAAEQGATDAAAHADDKDEQAEELALVGLDNFSLAPPEYLSMQESDYLIRDTITRICDHGVATRPIKDVIATNRVSARETGKAGGPSMLWSTLITRLATRGFAEHAVPAPVPAPASREGGGEASAESSRAVVERTLANQADTIRGLLLEFLKADFGNRIDFAVSWLAEEWHCDRIRRKQGAPEQYARWLEKVVEAWVPHIDGKDKTLATLLADLPSLPQGVIDRMGKLCRDKNRMATAMSTLQDIILNRPPIREEASERLLELTRATDRATRKRAIITIKHCAGQSSVLEGSILAFARSSLDLLKDAPAEPKPEPEPEPDPVAVKKQDESAPGEEEEEEEKEPSKYPTDGEDVLRFVELAFSLCTKMPDMLDEIFAAYPRMPGYIQKAVEKHIVDLIRALGPNNARLLTLLRNFPTGADSLALCVFKILSEKGRTAGLVSIVKELVEAREVDARFLVPIMADLDKAEIMARLPRVVTILGSKAAEDRALVKSVFQSIVTTPPQGFGSVSTNVPRVRQTELLTPVELMGLLHRAEKEIGLKNTVTAIQICFSMTDVFRSEVLGAVLNQILEEPTLPVLFMRTVIMAVSTYKSLSGYVSKNLLSRLITKKIWQNGPLWDGFILCAKQTAPSSFGALIQLPKEQLRQVVSRQPELRTGLIEYLTKKAGGNRARLAAFMDLLGAEAEAEAGPAAGGKEGEGDGGAEA